VLEGRDQEDQGMTPARAKSYRDSISIEKVGMVVPTCNPGYMGGIGKSQGSDRPQANTEDPIQKNN
jgi:hypothetical protein